MVNAGYASQPVIASNAYGFWPAAECAIKTLATCNGSGYTNAPGQASTVGRDGRTWFCLGNVGPKAHYSARQGEPGIVYGSRRVTGFSKTTQKQMSQFGRKRYLAPIFSYCMPHLSTTASAYHMAMAPVWSSFPDSWAPTLI